MSEVLKAINAVMQRVHYVHKGGENAYHGYRYTTEADLLAVLRPAMIEAGLILIPSLDGEPILDEYGNTHLVMSYTLAHISGEIWPDRIRMAGSGNDRNRNGVGDKGAFKAITGSNKYALLKLFQIETGDDPEIPNTLDMMDADPPARETGETRRDQRETRGTRVTDKRTPPPPPMPESFYIPTEDDPLWEREEGVSVMMNNILFTLENEVKDMKMMSKYWSALAYFRQQLGEGSDVVAELKAAFHEYNGKLGEKG